MDERTLYALVGCWVLTGILILAVVLGPATLVVSP